MLLLAATRLQRWALILATYQYKIEYKKSAEHANADALSRIVSGNANDGLANIFWISYLDEMLVTTKGVASATRKEPVLACTYDCIDGP